ncbi:glycosyltransferase [Clostridium neonatale]|uniref:glycosyltransferase n=1 Tax=Clostridium neonatale TaxID=137838 RepID=UPI001B36B98A|nr:glycosyltransferase [Clostridium neonatale]MBP8313496.1 hypothetical protein [Clostridium neonatale]CAI3535245.1 hypothetical protein CNEO4_1030073 [Clostridium neonatale]CAI3541528.1 hypothetical protein CNEO3_150073 [Clostridium neonatale]CAI3566365.1 hypothetical protein CNEO3_110073 [Clostridium neonatale]CAI3575078.1 hypothetical protein CNEO3_120073 [Clostridium neonatale]
MEVYLFGASLLGEKALKNLQDKYKIIAFLDNDSNKWNKRIKGVEVLNPNYIRNKSSVIVIITSSYYLQIVEQLKKIGVEDIRVYFDGNISNSFYIEKIEKCKLCKKTDADILLVISFYSIYIEEYTKKIFDKYNIRFDILTRDKGYKSKLNNKCINNVYYYNNYDQFKNIIRFNEYKCIHIHYLEKNYIEIANSIRHNCERLVITYWGSDFYRQSINDIIDMKAFLDSADIITFDNNSMLDQWCNIIGVASKKKCKITRFGLTNLEYIDQNKIDKNSIKLVMNLPIEKIIIMCGYNANEEQNHMQIFEEFAKLNNEIKNKIHLIVPMTYGNSNIDYMLKVKKLLKEINISYTILIDFMDFSEMANLIKVTDIMIQVQTTDSLSATMLENLYAGNVVITGGWLPYEELRDNNIYFKSIDSIQHINFEIVNIIKNLKLEKNKCIVNRKKVYKLSSWENNIPEWFKLYFNEME